MTWLIGIKITEPGTKKYFTPLKNFKKNKGTSLAGFSLIELLVVIVILGSILSFSLPSFRTAFNNLKFDNFSQDLVSRMRYLQERASLEQKNYRLNFDFNNRIIKIEVKKDDSEVFTDTPGLLGKKITIPEGINIEMTQHYIFFYPDGNIEGNDIKVSGYRNKATIYIKGSIGRINLEKSYE